MLNGALPTFDLAGGDIALVLVRSLFVATLLSALGTFHFGTLILPRCAAETAAETSARLDRLGRASLLGAAALAILWLVLQARAFAGDSGGGFLRAIPVTLGETAFGRALGLQFLLILGGLGAAGRGRRGLGLLCLILATAAQAAHGHALAIESGPSWLLASDVIHLLCAGLWLGGLIPLRLFISRAGPHAAATAAQQFSRVGIGCVFGLVVSAGFQAWCLIGTLPGLVGTAQGWVALAKLSLFLGLLGLAAVNRFRFTPKLGGVDAPRGRRLLLRSIGVETGLGLATVLAAGLMASLPPAIHQQPVWPFTGRPSLVTLEEAPEFLAGVEAGLAILLLGLLMVMAGLLGRRVRWVPIAVGFLLIPIALPRLRILFVEASPMSFYHSPTGFSAGAIVDGAALYPTHCAGCHGPLGRGDGPGAVPGPIRPADLTAGHLWAHEDGELFFWLSQGMSAPDDRPLMPGFADSLSEDQRWDLIDFIRARNAGMTRAATGTWTPPLQAPGVTAVCPDGRKLTAEDLRGRLVRLVFAAAERPDLVTGRPRDPGQMITILAPTEASGARPRPGVCITGDLAIGQAYAIVAGIPMAELPGAQFLIDRLGWLRAFWTPGSESASNWGDPVVLDRQIDRIEAEPLTALAPSPGHHH